MSRTTCCCSYSLVILYVSILARCFTCVWLTVYVVCGSNNYYLPTLVPVMKSIKEIFHNTMHISIWLTLFKLLAFQYLLVHKPQTIVWLFLSIQNVAVSATINYHLPIAYIHSSVHSQRIYVSHLKPLVIFLQTHHHQPSTCFTQINKDSSHLVTNYIYPPILKIFLVALISAILGKLYLTVDNLVSALKCLMFVRIMEYVWGYK